jgi:hypothetical protein
MHEELRIARFDGLGQTRIGKDGEFGLPCSCRVLLSEDLSYLASMLRHRNKRLRQQLLLKILIKGCSIKLHQFPFGSVVKIKCFERTRGGDN